MPSFVNLIGQKFSRLKVISKHPEKNKHGNTLWECNCDCGKKVITTTAKLRSGHTGSCGCFHRDMMVTRKTTHGLARTPEYNSWEHIKQRCYNKKHDRYKDYGGRGITMCDEWKDNFKIFYRDMGRRPENSYSVERRDNSKGYYKENCYWATPEEQNNNKRNNIFYVYNGVGKTLARWCRELNLNYSIIHNRLQRGYSFEEAIKMSSKH